MYVRLCCRRGRWWAGPILEVIQVDTAFNGIGEVQEVHKAQAHLVEELSACFKYRVLGGVGGWLEGLGGDNFVVAGNGVVSDFCEKGDYDCGLSCVGYIPDG